jgi:hypothetical protein
VARNGNRSTFVSHEIEDTNSLATSDVNEVPDVSFQLQRTDGSIDFVV